LVSVDDTTVADTPDDSVAYTLAITDINEPPTLSLENTVTALAEDSDTSERQFVADIVIDDDNLGENQLSLSGIDAEFFEIVDNNKLYLKAGVSLDVETKSEYNVTVSVDDTTVADTPDDSVAYTLAITDINEPPTVDIDKTITVLEDSGETPLNINQPTDVDGDELTITIDIIPNSNKGTIYNNGVAVNAGEILAISDLTNLVFTPVTNENGEAGNFSYTVSDGVNNVSQTITFNIAPVNDAPNLIIPTTQNAQEATDLSITGISINDLDAAIVQVTLTVNNGVISLNNIQDLTITNGTGNEDTTVTFAGSINDINGALNGLIYRSNLDFEGTENLTITVNDLGNTGEGGALEVSDTLNITVTSSNQPPNAELDKLLTVEQDSDENSLNISPPTDPDHDELTITVTAIPESSQGVIELDNKPVAVNQTLTTEQLQQLVFIPAPGFTGNGGTFSYLVEDGQGGSDTQTITFNISPVIILREGENFKVVHEEAVAGGALSATAIPETSSKLRFTYTSLSFDLSNTDFMNDAFEVALLGSDGQSLVYTLSTDQDVFFNFSEDQGGEGANGVTVEGNTVSLDISYLAQGTDATLVFRLVNNDNDTETTVRISGIEIVANDSPITGAITPNNFAFNSLNVINFEALADVSDSTQAHYQQTSFNEDTNTLWAEVAIENSGTYGFNTPLIVAIANLSDSRIEVVNADGVTPEGLPYFDFSNLVTEGTLDPGELSNSKSIAFSNPNEIQFTYDLIVLSDLNIAPEIISNPVKEIVGGLTYSYDVNAVDENNDVLTYELIIAPQGISINPETGLLTWETSIDDIANHQITVQVSDGRGGIDTQTYTLSVINQPPNRPPIFVSSPVVDAFINQLYVYDSDAVDPDQDNLTYSIILGPDGMRIAPDTGLVEWTPLPAVFLGDTVIGKISLPGENDRFSFSGVAGQKIYFDHLITEGNLHFDIYSPSDRLVVNNSWSGGLTLQETGNYEIVIDGQEDATGRYGFTVIDTGLLPITPFDTLIEGQLSPGTEDDVYRFVSFEGQKLFLDQLSNQGSLDWILYDKNFKEVFRNDFADRELYLPEDGEYFLALRGKDFFDASVTYSFEIITPDEITTSISYQDVIEGEITEKGENDFYTFMGKAGEQLFYDGLGGDLLNFRLYDPNEIQLFSANSAQDRGPDNNLTLNQNGTYRLEFDGNGEATGNYKFRLLNKADNLLVQLDTDTIIGTYDNGGIEAEGYRFTLTEKDYIYIDSQAGNNLNPALLYGSGGQYITGVDVRFDYENWLEPGEYWLIMQGNGATDINYKVRLITPDFITTTLSLDTSITGNISEKGERDYYTFTGTKRQELFFDTLIQNNNFVVTLLSPSGTEVGLNNTGFSNDWTRNPFILPEGGTYQLIIDGVGETTGNYGFRLADVGNVELLALDTQKSETIEPGNSIKFLEFNGNKGERIYLDRSFSSNNIATHLYYGTNELGENTTEYVLSETGTYTLMLRGEDSNPITYNIQVVTSQSVPQTLTPNSFVTGSIGKLGEQDVYTINATEGQFLYFDPRLGNTNITASLVSPSGQALFTGNTANDSQIIRVLESGTYRLTVDGVNATVGDYSFVLFNSASPMALGTPLQGNLGTNQAVLYQFNGTKGQELEFSNISNVNWSLYAQGQVIGGGSVLANYGNNWAATIPSNGVYTLVLQNPASQAVDYNFSVKVAPLSGDNVVWLAGNNLTSGRTVNAGTGNDELIADFTNANFSGINAGGQGIYNHSEGINGRYWNNRLLTISSVEVFNITGTPYADIFNVKEGDKFDGGAGYDTLNLNLANATTAVDFNFSRTENQLIYGDTVVKNFETLGTLTTGSADDVINLGNTESVDNGGTVDTGLGTDILTVDFTNANFSGINAGGQGIYNHSEGINGRYWNNRLLTISSVEIFNITGTPYNDIFNVKEGDKFDGGAGYDTLNLNLTNANTAVDFNFSRTENQLIYGDTVVKNFETLGTLTTGSADDVINLGNTESVDNGGTVDTGLGTDILTVDFTNANFSGINAGGQGIYNHSEGINGRYWNNRLLTISNVEVVNITGTPYADILQGFANNDILIGGAGNDNLNGGDGDDLIVGVNPSSANPGSNEVDTLAGGNGADRFVLGNTTTAFYDDGNTTNAGTSNYALITDFNPSQDVIQLYGDKANYRLVSGITNGIAGTAIYMDKSDGEPDELIAIIQGVTGLDINSSAFVIATDTTTPVGAQGLQPQGLSPTQTPTPNQGTSPAPNNLNTNNVSVPTTTTTNTGSTTNTEGASLAPLQVTILGDSGLNKIYNNTLATGETDSYTFTGNSGSFIFFDGLAGTLRASLQNPDGSFAFSNLQTNTDSGAYLLPQTGDYNLTVGSGTGDYRFNLIDLDTASDLTLNTATTLNLNLLETKAYKFTGNAGEMVWFDGLNGTNPNVTARLYNANGFKIGEQTNLPKDIGLTRLEQDGTYYVVLSSNNSAATTANFRVLSDRTLSPITLDSDISGNFGTTRNEAALYKFNGTEGQRIYFDRSAGSSNNWWNIYYPSGQYWTQAGLDSDMELVLPSTGEYFLAPQGFGDANSNYAFRLITSATPTTGINLNQVVTDSIAETGQFNIYTFTATQGQRIFFDALSSPDGNLRWTLVAPSGDRTFNSAYVGDDQLHTLSETGTYQLLVDGSGAITGNYSFQLLDWETNTTLINLDTPVTSNFANSRETDLYRFSGTQEQAIYFNLTDGASGNWRLYDAADNFISQWYGLGSDFEMLLPYTGDYTLRLSGNGGGDNTYAFTLVTPERITTNYTLGTSVNSSISEAGEEDYYTFTGTAGQKLWLDSLNYTNGNLTASLITPSGRQLFSQGLSGDRVLTRLDETGTYTLKIDANGDITGNYGFRLLDWENATPLDLNSLLTGKFDITGGEEQLYRFNGEEGQRLYFASVTSSDNDYYQLYNSSGQLLVSQWLRSDYEYVLPKDDEYLLILHDDRDNLELNIYIQENVLFGTENSVLNLNGVNNYVTTNNLVGLNTGNQVHTIEQWVYLENLPSQRAWLSVLGQYGGGSHHWLVNTNGQMQIGVYGNNSGQLRPTFPVGQWTHLATVHDGSTLTLFINGENYGSVSANFNFTNTDFNLGFPLGSENYFNGKIDEVRVWNKVRTQAEIQASFNKKLTGNETGLYQFAFRNVTLN
jgi:hypothetical protein